MSDISGTPLSLEEVKTNREELRRLINESPEQFFEPDKHGGYICPLCGSGSGEKGTGATIKKMASGNLRISCWSCGFKGSVIDWIIEWQKIDFNGALEYGAAILSRQDLLGKEASPFSYKQNIKKTKPILKGAASSTLTEQEQQDYTYFYKECAARIEDTNYHRGISIETLKAYWIGYCPEWRSPTRIRKGKNAPYSPRLIIPFDKSSYLARDTRNSSDIDEKYKEAFERNKKLNEGNTKIFNKKILHSSSEIFIVEGAIDALSIIDVGGQAIGLNSMSNADLLIRELSKIDKADRPTAMIIALDNEAKTQKTSIELQVKLKELGIMSILANDMFGQYKDANDYLIADRQGLKLSVEGVKAEIIRKCAASSNLTEQDEESERRDTLYTGEIRAENSMNDKFIDKEIVDTLQGEYEANKAISETSQLVNFGDYLKSGKFQNVIKEYQFYKELKTGFSNMQQPLYSGLYLIGAISSLGKTTLNLNIAEQIATAGHKVIFISYEQSAGFLTAKILSRKTFELSKAGQGEAISAGQIIKGACGTALKNAIDEYSSSEAGKNLTIFEAGMNDTIEKICAMIETTYLSKGIKPIVFIDYLQIIPASQSKQSAKEKIDHIVFSLNQFQRKHKLVMWVISSVNRQNYLQVFDFESFKESGGIEFTADLVYGMQLKVMNELSKSATNIDEKRKKIREAKAENPRKIELICLKNRYGATGQSHFFNYYAAYDYFEALDDDIESIEQPQIIAGKKKTAASSKLTKQVQEIEEVPPPTDDDYYLGDSDSPFDDED